MGIAGSLVGGYVGIRTSPKKALSSALVGSVASLSILGFVSDTYSLALGFLFYAFFSYAVWSPMNTIMADITPAATRGLGFSIYLLMEGLMISAAPILAAEGIELLDVWVIFPLSIGFLVASVFLLQHLLHPPG